MSYESNPNYKSQLDVAYSSIESYGFHMGLGERLLLKHIADERISKLIEFPNGVCEINRAEELGFDIEYLAVHHGVIDAIYFFIKQYLQYLRRITNYF